MEDFVQFRNKVRIESTIYVIGSSMILSVILGDPKLIGWSQDAL